MSKDKEKCIDQIITDFVEGAIQNRIITTLDRLFVTNRIMNLLDKEAIQMLKPSTNTKDMLSLLDTMIDYAVDKKLIEDLPSLRDVFGAKLMNLITPFPSQVNYNFWEAYKKGPKQATDLFFKLSQQTNYIKTREIEKNIEYTHDTEYGQLQITINLSKPEKDPKEIAKAREKTTRYPECALCMENEGYEGHLTHPGRANHRIIRMEINGEEWGFQYSPYAYYNEHAIFLSREHREMNVGIQAIENLLDILTTLPHYFVGSNAGLPIVGGSILSHDHYQGGRHTFPLEKAEAAYSFDLPDYTHVKASVIKWPMSVIRLTASDKVELVQAAKWVMDSWEHYSDDTVDIISETEGTPHNAVTPIARRKGQDFELDLVLRNNRTSEIYPDGIFHPHPPVQHIKKENVGLIEVMGLAILPPRLKAELQEVRNYVLDKQHKINPIHLEWADAIKQERDVTEERVDVIIEKAVGEVFLQVLKDAGVFKQDEKGKRAFKQFINQLTGR